MRLSSRFDALQSRVDSAPTASLYPCRLSGSSLKEHVFGHTPAEAGSRSGVDSTDDECREDRLHQRAKGSAINAAGTRSQPSRLSGRAPPDVEVTTAWGQPALKVHGKMFVCTASHQSADPNSLFLMMPFADRDALVEDDPGAFHLNTHYLNHPCVLVRLPRIRLDALQDLVVGAHRIVNADMRVKSDNGNHRATARPSRDRADRS
jgi:hypothetical protein